MVQGSVNEGQVRGSDLLAREMGCSKVNLRRPRSLTRWLALS